MDGAALHASPPCPDRRHRRDAAPHGRARPTRSVTRGHRTFFADQKQVGRRWPTAARHVHRDDQCAESGFPVHGQCQHGTRHVPRLPPDRERGAWHPASTRGRQLGVSPVDGHRRPAGVSTGGEVHAQPLRGHFGGRRPEHSPRPGWQQERPPHRGRRRRPRSLLRPARATVSRPASRDADQPAPPRQDGGELVRADKAGGSNCGGSAGATVRCRCRTPGAGPPRAGPPDGVGARDDDRSPALTTARLRAARPG